LPVTKIVVQAAMGGELRIDTPGEAGYFRHVGIMQYVLQSLLD
jgi:hypothetical protein